jgi:hypothetical protein
VGDGAVANNRYLEVHIDGGVIALFLLALLLVAGLARTGRGVSREENCGILKLSLWRVFKRDQSRHFLFGAHLVLFYLCRSENDHCLK